VFAPTTFRHTKRLPIRISRPSHKKFHFKKFHFKNTAATYNVAKERRQKSNNTFVEYVLTRLEEMGPDEAQKKRKVMLVILEGLQD
jgi:hypothetical protein